MKMVMKTESDLKQSRGWAEASTTNPSQLALRDATVVVLGQGWALDDRMMLVHELLPVVTAASASEAAQLALFQVSTEKDNKKVSASDQWKGQIDHTVETAAKERLL
jgi:hypothetical protein